MKKNNKYKIYKNKKKQYSTNTHIHTKATTTGKEKKKTLKF